MSGKAVRVSSCIKVRKERRSKDASFTSAEGKRQNLTSRGENRSLERIHTFHLKRSSAATEGKDSSDSKSPRKSVKDLRAFYIKEQAKVDMDAFMRSTQPVIQELSTLLQKDPKTPLLNNGYPNLLPEFFDDGDFEALKHHHTSKVSIRNVLGLPKSSLTALGKPTTRPSMFSMDREDQWIFHFNIGNVMQLIPISLQDMLRLEGKTRMLISSLQSSP